MPLATRILDGSLTLEQLEAALAMDERLLGTLCGLEPRDTGTIASYDSTQPAPAGDLIVMITGPARPPRRARLVLHGHAFVSGGVQPVSVFRQEPDESSFEAEEMPDAADREYLSPDEGWITGPARDRA